MTHSGNRLGLRVRLSSLPRHPTMPTAIDPAPLENDYLGVRQSVKSKRQKRNSSEIQNMENDSVQSGDTSTATNCRFF